MPAMNTELHYLTKEEVERLLAAVSQESIRDTAIWNVAYWHGLRASEVGMLQFSDWRQETGRLFIRRVKGSNSGEYMTEDGVIRALRAWAKVRGTDPGPMFPSQRGGQPISRQRLHNLMREYCDTAGILAPRNHFHVLRHSIAVHMADKGIDVAKIQDWLGHKSITSTMVYVKITSHARNSTADVLFGKDEQERERKENQDRPRVKWAKDRPQRKKKATAG